MPRITIYNRAGVTIRVKVGGRSQNILDGANASFNPAASERVEAEVAEPKMIKIQGGALTVPTNSTAMDIRVEERVAGSAPIVIIGLTGDPVL